MATQTTISYKKFIAGNFGICPVAFCVWCYASIVDMVSQGCLRCQEDDDPTIN